MINEITKRTLSTIVLLPLAFFIIYDGSIAFILFLISLFLISIFEWFKMITPRSRSPDHKNEYN